MWHNKYESRSLERYVIYTRGGTHSLTSEVGCIFPLSQDSCEALHAGCSCLCYPKDFSLEQNHLPPHQEKVLFLHRAGNNSGRAGVVWSSTGPQILPFISSHRWILIGISPTCLLGVCAKSLLLVWMFVPCQRSSTMPCVHSGGGALMKQWWAINGFWFKSNLLFLM